MGEKLRLHVCSVPHTQTTKEFLSCAYTADVINFCKMMMGRGHEVFLYSGEKNEAPCTEHIPCVSEQDRLEHLGSSHFITASYDTSLPLWQKANTKMAEEIAKRAQKTDFVCIIVGAAQKQITDALPHLISVEFAVGYGGTFLKRRVFKSYAWMHTVYGSETFGNPHAADGGWWDDVIPGYLDFDMFPKVDEREDYFLFIGRLIERKGYGIAVEVARELGKKLIVCGHGVPPAGVDYRGVVGPEERCQLMSRAKAVFVPTTYLEPFGYVNIEAQACGTPVITTDWGAFTENVEQGKTGFRCRNFNEFKEAAINADSLDRSYIAEQAKKLYSFETIGLKYERYFERLLTLWDAGWYVGKSNWQATQAA